jgi:hypothetical protein
VDPIPTSEIVSDPKRKIQRIY